MAFARTGSFPALRPLCLRLGTLMLAVAIIALGVGNELMKRRRVSYLRMASYHAGREAGFRKSAANNEFLAAHPRRYGTKRLDDWSKRLVEWHTRRAGIERARAAYHGEMKRRF